MSIFDRVWGALLGQRVDAAPAPALPGPAVADDWGTWRGDSLANPLSGFGTGSDKGSSALPDLYRIPLSDDHLRVLYGFNGLARRIVDLPATRACRKGWSAPDIGGTEERRLRIFAKTAQAMQMGDLYGGAAMLLVTEDDVPRQFRARPVEWLRQPLDLRRVQRLAAVQVFDAFEAFPQDWESDLRATNYRSPSLWSFQTISGWNAWVHGSRVVYFPGRRRPPSEARGARSRWSWGNNRMPDDSVLQVIYDELSRLIQTAQGGAVAATQLQESVLKVGSMKSKQTSDEKKEFQARLTLMQRMKSALHMILIGPDDEYVTRSTPPTGFKELSGEAKSLLAAVTGIPEMVLFGDSPSGLSTDGEGSHEGFRQFVSDYQEAHREPIEQITTVVYAAQDGPTRGQIPKDWSLEFHPLDEPSEDDKAKTRLTVAQTDHIYVTDGIYAPETVAEQRFGPNGFQFELVDVPIPDPADDAAIEAARQQVEAEMAGEGTPGGRPGAKQVPARRADLAGSAPRDLEYVRAGAGASGGAVVPDSCCILVPAADTGLREAVERAIGQQLVVEDEPHVTILYLGPVDPTALPTVLETVAEEAARAMPGSVERGSVRPFPAGADGVPIVVEFNDLWAVQGLHDVLLARLAHLVAAPQHRTFRAHLTIGHAPAPLSAEAIGALAGIDASGIRVPISAVAVQVGEETVAVTAVGS